MSVPVLALDIFAWSDVLLGRTLCRVEGIASRDVFPAALSVLAPSLPSSGAREALVSLLAVDPDASREELEPLCVAALSASASSSMEESAREALTRLLSSKALGLDAVAELCGTAPLLSALFEMEELAVAELFGRAASSGLFASATVVALLSRDVQLPAPLAGLYARFLPSLVLESHPVVLSRAGLFRRFLREERSFSELSFATDLACAGLPPSRLPAVLSLVISAKLSLSQREALTLLLPENLSDVEALVWAVAAL